MALLEVKGITKVFGGLKAVENVEFKVDQGEIISIIGPNGAGKTTIYNMLTGVYKVDGGAITFEGKDIHNRPPREIVKAGIARTFQNIRLFPTMRVIENVLLGEHINVKYHFWDLLLKTPKYRREEKAAHQRAIDLLESLDLADEIDNYAKNLPYGMQRKLEIARALATNAKLIILDEPAAGMNPQESEELMEFIRSLRERGETILLIEHDMNVVMNISDRIYVIDHGRKIAEGLPKEIAKNPEVIKAYLGSGGAAGAKENA
ncbi:MAG: ABC transporter ATP-binding protein [Lachnospiraceae bacterium]|jgi:branched-chain amino acid transport system ATP-binding protein|nr:ABC transporter ATP-binding protein [Lachnospiraceae bacterium]